MINMSRLPQRHFKCLTTLDTNRSLCPHNHPLIGSLWKLRRKGAVARSHEFFIQFETERLKNCVKQFSLFVPRTMILYIMSASMLSTVLFWFTFSLKKYRAENIDTWRKKRDIAVYCVNSYHLKLYSIRFQINLTVQKLT